MALFVYSLTLNLKSQVSNLFPLFLWVVMLAGSTNRLKSQLLFRRGWILGFSRLLTIRVT